LKEDAAARDRARQYLQGIKGVDRIYRGILADAEKTLAKPQQLGILAPNYKQVLSSKGDVSPAFTQEGWRFVQNASKKEGNTGALGESCVIGNSLGLVGGLKQDAEVERAIQQFFIRDYIAQWQAFIAGFSVVQYKNAADAAQKLNILADHRSPLLALLAMTANQTNFPVTTESSALEKVPLLGDMIKKGEKAGQQKLAALQTDQPVKLSTADITRSFQPVHWVVPPGSETWVVDKNSAYIAALTQLGHSMQDIAAGGNPDPAVYQAASQNAVKALEAAKQIAVGFKPVGVAGLDGEVERLLEEPIQSATRLIPADFSKVGADKINAALRNLCGRINNTLRKYPFQPKSREDAKLEELASVFAPAGGPIWRFSGESLSELVTKEGSQWRLKDPAKKPQVTQEMLNFLNQAQAIADAFYPAGATQPRFTYSLRPNLDPAFGDSKFELEIDGAPYLWTSPLQHSFAWPPAPNTANPGASARIRGQFSYPFANRRGLWGIFRIMSDAEPRALLNKTVEWKFSQVGDGPKEPIDPGPVRLEFVQFPGGADVFNPKFYDGLQCPTKAVQ
jgi:type VI protein secretion system component VasK